MSETSDKLAYISAEYHKTLPVISESAACLSAAVLVYSRMIDASGGLPFAIEVKKAYNLVWRR